MRRTRTGLPGAVAAVLCMGIVGTGLHAAEEPRTSPITIELVRNDFASFTNQRHPGNRIGYRFHEHTPIILGRAPDSYSAAAIDPASVERLAAEISRRPGCVSYKRRVGEKGWIPQTWTFHMAPADDGVDLLLVVETGDTGLNRYYGIQQCFRLSGATNAEWRRKIALTPAFSEYDRWALEKNAARKTSLTWVPRKGAWQSLPATTSAVGCRTPFGVRIDSERMAGNLASMKRVGHYDAIMLEPIDCGLITRSDLDGNWVCGIHWEGTSHVTDHHPADCLHAIVNIGNVPPNSKRAIRGKIYWFRGTKDDLLKRWNRDFKISLSKSKG